MIDTISAQLLTFEIRANVTPNGSDRQTVESIDLTAAYNAAIPLLRYYAEDILKDLSDDLSDIVAKLENRKSNISTSPKIVFTKHLTPRPREEKA